MCSNAEMVYSRTLDDRHSDLRWHYMIFLDLLKFNDFCRHIVSHYWPVTATLNKEIILHIFYAIILGWHFQSSSDVKKGFHLRNMPTEMNLSHLDELRYLRERSSSKSYHSISYVTHVWNVKMVYSLYKRRDFCIIMYYRIYSRISRKIYDHVGSHFPSAPLAANGAVVWGSCVDTHS